MLNSSDFIEFLWETNEFVCFILIAFIHVYNNARDNRPRLTRSAILQPYLAPWERLINFGDDGSFLTMTGFSRPAFLILETILKPPPPPFKLGGRPSKLNFRAQLGLFLMWCCSRMKIKELCLLFGCVPSSAHRYLKKMLSRAAPILRKHPDAVVKFPDVPEMARLANLVALREPRVRNVVGFVDGCSIKIECTSEPNIQNAYYDGFTCDTCVNNVLLFSPEGKILFAAINFPGSWHDSAVSFDLIRTVLDAVGDEDFAFCVDQGFPRSGLLQDKFVGPYSKKFLKKLDAVVRELLLERIHRYISLRQSAEWGMRALQGTFTRLKSRLTSNNRMRKLIIETVILLSNFRTAHVGLNQIATVFNPHYEQVINLDGYDRIARYFYNGNDFN